jgi:two-component system, NarL family, response regulator LiaR
MNGPQPRPIRVMLADDHAMVRSGLSAFLLAYDDMELVGEATNGADAVRSCVGLQPDVVLMDLVMPEMDGATATRLIREQCPGVRVIALTTFQDDALIEAALRAGALSFLLKNVSADELADAIRAAMEGRSTLAPEAAQILVQRTAQQVGPGPDLSPQERKVLALLVEGHSNPQIAAKLGIGRSTVKFHVSGILAKLGVETRTSAVALAVQHHLLD